MPRLTGSPPARRTSATSVWVLLLADLAAAQDLLGLVHVDDLVAAAEDGDARPAVDQRMRHRERREHAQLAGPSSVPSVSTVAPRRMSSPAGRMLTPASRSFTIADRRRRRRRCPPGGPRCRRPSGSGAPVKIRAHSPGPIGAGREAAGRKLLDHAQPHRRRSRSRRARPRRARRSRPSPSWSRPGCRAGSRRPRPAPRRARRRAGRGAPAGGGRPPTIRRAASAAASGAVVGAVTAPARAQRPLERDARRAAGATWCR